MQEREAVIECGVVGGSLENVSKGFYKEEGGIGWKVQRGIRGTSIPFPAPEDQRDMGKNLPSLRKLQGRSVSKGLL